MLANANSKAKPIVNIVLNAADEAFGSGNSSSSSSLPANQSTTVSRRPKLPRHAGATPCADDCDPGVDRTGTYYNAGYGAGMLCSVHSSSPSCQNVLYAFRSIDPSLSPNSTSPDLFASWITVFSTHIRFTYANDSQYSVTVGSIYPQGYGKNSSPFPTLAPFAKAEFVMENEKVVGFGWNNINDDGDVQTERAGSACMEETSEVLVCQGGINLDSSFLPAALRFATSLMLM